MVCDHIHRMRIALEAHSTMMAYRHAQIEQDLAIPQYGIQTLYNPDSNEDQVYKTDDLFMDTYMDEGWEYQGSTYTPTTTYEPEQTAQEVYVINQPTVVHHSPQKQSVVATAANQPKYMAGLGLYKPQHIDDVVESLDEEPQNNDVQSTKSALARAVFGDIHALDQSDRKALFAGANPLEQTRQELKASIEDALGTTQPMLYN